MPDQISENLSLVEAVLVVLKERPNHAMGAREIAVILLARRPEVYRLKRERSTQKFETDGELIQQIIAEIGAQRLSLMKGCPQVRATATRPRRYVYLDGNSAEMKDVVSSGEMHNHDALMVDVPSGKIPITGVEPRIIEADMYPILSHYLLDEHDIRTKRIDEKRSSNRRGSGGNKWLHPDVVGVETTWSGWNAGVRECAKTLSDLRARQWSFEAKLSIHLGNVREAYFQAVSNSSWANFGYLVAAQVDEAVMPELRMLFAAHGVGLIVLNVKNPSESEIVIPARERFNIDWVQVNRLAEENKDFMDFVNLIRQFHLIGEVKNEDWDARPMDAS